MKKILCLLLTLSCSITLWGQSNKHFEGSIFFSFDVTGGGEELELSRAFLPHGYKLQVKGEKVRMRMEGGMVAAMFGDIVFDGSTNLQFMLNDANKTVTMMPAEKAQEAKIPEGIKVERGSNDKEIAGYQTQHYLVKNDNKPGELMEFWVTEALNFRAPKGNNSSPLGAGYGYGIKGFPLQLVMEQAGMTITMEAKSVKQEKLADQIFEIPNDYKKSEFNPAMFNFGGDE
ncbi:MAG: DUF4412 domain-containing protein [Bacteroidia bacterium]